MIKNTTGAGARIWQSNQNLLANLGGLISGQQGLSYTFQGLSQQFQELYPDYQVTSTPGAQSPQVMTTTTLNTLNGALASAQAQAQNFTAEQATLQQLELKNQTAIGNLQAIQVSNELALAQVQQIQMLRQLVMTRRTYRQPIRSTRKCRAIWRRKRSSHSNILATVSIRRTTRPPRPSTKATLADAGGFSEMKRINLIILFPAGIGFCAVIYAGWHYYQEKRSAAQNQAVFSAPYSGDTFNPKNNALPPPQH